VYLGGRCSGSLGGFFATTIPLLIASIPTRSQIPYGEVYSRQKFEMLPFELPSLVLSLE
jgi:hypothetical protein